MQASASLVETRGLARDFLLPGPWPRRPRRLQAVAGVDLDIRRGECLALVGESGSGKTTMGRLILALLLPSRGAVRIAGLDPWSLRGGELRALRRRMGVVFQDPFGSLNPRWRVGDIVGEGLTIHRVGTRAERRARVAGLLQRVGLDPGDAARGPHEFSGGQRQRIGIARALALQPEFVVLDEAVSALDVSVQAQVINLLTALQDELGLSYLFIAHDLAVVEHIAHRVAVMYLGRVVELGTKSGVFTAPRHPYTRALMAAAPRPDPHTRGAPPPLPGEPPSPLDPPAGCPFHPRCALAEDRCRRERPELRPVGSDHLAACHLAEAG